MSEASEMLSFCSWIVGQAFDVLGNIEFFEYKLWQLVLAFAFAAAFAFWAVKQITGHSSPDSSYETEMYRIDRSSQELQSLDAGGWHERFDGLIVPKHSDVSPHDDDFYFDAPEPNDDYADMEGF